MKGLRGLLCVLLALCLLPVQAGAAPAAWAEADVERADRLGLIPAECSFNYQRDVTREQIAAILRGGCGADAAAVRACLISQRVRIGEIDFLPCKAKSRRNPDGLQGFLTQSGRKICRQGGRGEMLNRLLRLSSSTPAKHPAGERFQLDRADVLSADYEIAQGIMAPNLGQAEVTGEQLDELIAAYNRACLTSSRYDPDPGDTVRSFSRWITLHMADGSDLPLCHRGTGEVRVWWGEGEGNMILRSLELYELLEEIVCPPDDPAGS